MVVKRSQPSTHLSKDSKVEVCSNEDGYKGAWFPAKIIDPDPPIPATRKKRKSLSGCSSRSSSSATKALIQYETLLSDNDPDKPLTELVEVGLIRPVPPSSIDDRPFEPGDKVDAFHLDAWWPGVVIKLEEDEYTVGFLDPPDLLVLRRSDLRSHWDLTDGVWVGAKKETMTGPNFIPGTAVEVNPSKVIPFYAWFPAIYLGQLGIDSFLLQYKISNNRDVKTVVCRHQIRPQPPLSDERDFSLLDKVDAFHDMGWWVGEITKVLEGNKYAVTLSCTRQEMEFSVSELRTHLVWHDERWSNEFRESHFRRDSQVPTKHSCQSSRSDYELQSCKSFGNSEVATPLRKKTPCSRISLKNQSKHLSPCMDKLPYVMTKKKSKKSQQPKDDETIASPSKKLKGGHSEDSLSFEKSNARRTPAKTQNKESPVTDVVIEKAKVGGLDDQALTHSKRKANPAGTANQQNEDNGRQVETGVTGNPAGTPNQQNEVNGRQVETVVTGEVDAEQNNSTYLWFSFCPHLVVLIYPIYFYLVLSKISSSQDAVRQVETVDSPVDCSTRELKLAAVKPIESSSNPAETANQQNEVTGTQVETGVTVNIEQQDSPDLPFVKSYPEIWEKVESMDAFKRYPQKPHFYPLVKCGELSRESLAVAKMLTFASLVEKTSKLNIEDPGDFFDSIFEELGDLETFGFDVKAVRDRLNSLLEIKVQLGHLQDKSKEVQIKIAEQTQDRKKHNEIICGVAKQIKDLQDQLVVLMSEDAAKGSEISRLQSEADAITESIQSIRRMTHWLKHGDPCESILLITALSTETEC
ncbi:DUF724 domain-containing protein 7 isoform X2 [Pyrus x bretschneideri]|uniref:DUF724 domain-containing protein 7 isoform X2 n=1 Tax=Pyrus x bretschneideri TaxID=225117 RepID=UPI00202EA2E7|nr:DUF724 domain-containing protein 7 isoform X2 [Pyrus x bretschneideri]